MFGATSLAGSCGNVRSPLFKAIFGSNKKGIFGATVTCSGQYGYFVISKWRVKWSRLVLGGFKLPKANHHGRWWRVDIPLRMRCSVEFVLNDGGHSISAGRTTLDDRFDPLRVCCGCVVGPTGRTCWGLRLGQPSKCAWQLHCRNARLAHFGEQEACDAWNIIRMICYEWTPQWVPKKHFQTFCFAVICSVC